MIKNTVLMLLIGSALLTASCATGHKNTQPSPKPQPVHHVVLSERLERIKMTDLDGRHLTLHDFEGKPVFFNFWATWCRPCISEMESIDALCEEYKNDVVFIAASSEDLEKIKAFRDQHNFHFQMVKLDIEYIDALVISLPTTLLINREGKMLYEEEGVRVWTSDNYRQKLFDIMK